MDLVKVYDDIRRQAEGLTQDNAKLLQAIAELEQENARLREVNRDVLCRSCDAPMADRRFWLVEAMCPECQRQTEREE